MVLKKGILFNIQKFSITDGVGIRTLIFMKGCPLRCLWCSNPESQKIQCEIMDVKTNCVGCGKCVGLCPEGAIDPDSFSINREKCTVCGRCAEFCYANAKKLVGKEYSVHEIIKILEKDRVFYSNSGGGVTVGGGEPTMQAEFVTELLKQCKAINIHTAIETCGYGDWDKIGCIFDYTDQIFFDLKQMDTNRHRQMTGVDNSLILENAAKVAGLGKKVIYRVPVIPGYNDDKDNIMATGEFVKNLMLQTEGDISLELLPYHNFGADKYKWIDSEYALRDTEKPSEAAINTYKDMLRGMGINIE